MIRREIQLPDREPQWWLVCQVEHARLSADLAERCLTHFGMTSNVDERSLQAMRQELLAAIVHHDDGWTAWEVAPQLDEQQGQPLSFRELPLEVSLPIWSASIDAAVKLGPLAAWVVAGHFLALLGSSEKSASLSAEWREKTTVRQANWFAVWQAQNPVQNTQSLANEALLWLQLFDVMSLWLCSVCPGRGESVFHPPESYHVGAGQPLETKFWLDNSLVRIEPWRFNTPRLEVEANGWTVPIKKYADSNELLAARSPHVVRWQIRET